MQVKFWLVASALAGVFASCGDATSDSNATDTTNVNTTTETTGSTTTQTTTRRNVEVPVATRTSFEAKYPQAATVTWSYPTDIEVPIDWELAGWQPLDTSYYVASFNQNNEDYWVWYDNDGAWLYTVTEVNDHAGLPSAVNATIRSEFPGYTIVSVDKENDKNRTAYEVELESGADKAKALIAENGKVIKKKTKVDGDKTKEKNNPKDSM